MRKPIWLALPLILILMLTGCGKPGSGDGDPRTEIVPIQVDKVEVAILKSLPAKVQLHVTGVIGDSCNSLDKVTQTREGNTITVKITAVRKLGGPCMELAQLYDEVINLEGTFASGTYTVTVNGVSKTFTV